MKEKHPLKSVQRPEDVTLLVECLPSLFKTLHKSDVLEYTCNHISQKMKGAELEVQDHPHILSGIKPALNI